ncbi:flagellar export protein FliJ [Baekduia soli]|uniref:Flagellar FliJ protein n=1 Tax=Baekduia soli TaxID=496014 RepID=A0A5B8U1M5_9ACTN|nr:flagellar export protein FliJ [Baekduia soli]QEC46840.1 flagellar export protein FliJ [Baekduia soli]
METPFRFGLERVREIRAHDEQQAKERFAASLNERLRAEAVLRAAQERLDDARGPGAPAAPVAVSGQTLLARQAWVDRLQRSREDAQRRLQGTDEDLRRVRVELTDASRRREVLDKLKERQREAHRQAAERRESAALDEMALAVHSRRRAAA